ncbi:MAG: tetratricopeptide repeat protein [Acidobacteria bacterium]|nr:tetratricopeptide repeat protein [Acidobacteriota bacterium]
MSVISLGPIAVLGHGPDATPEGEWEEAIGAAKQAAMEGEFEQMEIKLKEAMKYAEKFEPNDMRLALTLNYLGWLYQNQGKYAEAEAPTQRVLAVLEKSVAPEHPLIAQALENYAVVLRKLKRDPEAEKIEARLQMVRSKSPEKKITE